MNAIWIVTVHTLREAKRRRILLAAIVFGGLVLALFGVGFALVARDVARHSSSLIERKFVLYFFLMAGLYAVNVLTVMTAAFLPIDTLSGEIASGVLQPVAAKPIRRSSIVLGKWLGHWIVIAGYLALMMTGVIAIAWTIGRVVPLHLERAVPLMLLEATLFLSVGIAGGTRLSTIANGIAVFGLYGFAFLAGWIEQIATFSGASAARDVGTAASLLMPSESLWQLAAHHMSPPLMRDLPASPFSPSSVPSGWAVAWAGLYVVFVLAWALRSFERRAL